MLILLVILNVVVCANAYPSGAPTSTCDNMTPSHGANAQNSQSSIRVSTVNKTCYSANQPLYLQISGGSFKGFLVAARTTSGGSIGSFVADTTQAKTLSCNSMSANELTHTSSLTKTSVKFSWLAPSNPPSQIYFRLTALKDFSTFWLSVDTSINICSDPVTTPTTKYTTASTRLITDTPTTHAATNSMRTTATRLMFESTTTHAATNAKRTTASDHATTLPKKLNTITTSKLSITTITPTNSTCSGLVESGSCKRIRNVDCYLLSYNKNCCLTCRRFFLLYGSNKNCPYGDKIKNCSKRYCGNDKTRDDYHNARQKDQCCYTCRNQS